MKNVVEPIRVKDKVFAVEKFLDNKSVRNKVIFLLDMNSGLRISDILQLNVSDVKNKTHIELKEKKTGKYKKFPINNKLKQILSDYIGDKRDNEPLFLSQKGYRMERSQVCRMLNRACKAVVIEENIGTHTMRKTFGYHHYKQFKDVAILQRIFNHSSPEITLRYIGINHDEIDQSYNSFEL